MNVGNNDIQGHAGLAWNPADSKLWNKLPDTDGLSAAEQRLKDIAEKLGSDHVDVAEAMFEYAKELKLAKRLLDSVNWEARAKAILAKNGYPSRTSPSAQLVSDKTSNSEQRDYDRQEEAEGTSPRRKPLEALVDALKAIAADPVDFAKGYFEQAKTMIKAPNVFFESMPTRGDLSEPMTFFTASLSVNAIMCGLLSFNPILPVLVLIVPVIQTVLNVLFLWAGAAIVSFIAKLMGGKGTYETTFRVYCFSKVGLTIEWIPLLGLLLSLVCGCLLLFCGLKKVHGLSTVKTIVVLIVTSFLSLMAAWTAMAVCGGLMIALLAGVAGHKI